VIDLDLSPRSKGNYRGRFEDAARSRATVIFRNVIADVVEILRGRD